MSELLLKLATKIYNKSEDELKPLIFDDEGKEIDAAFENLLALDTARVKRFKDDNTKNNDDGYKRGVKEKATEIENFYKQRYEIDVDGNYEAIAEKIDERLASSKARGKEFTEDDIKKHPFFLNYEKNVIPKDKHSALQQEYEGYKVKVVRDQKFSQVKSQAKRLLETFQPDFTMYTDAPHIKNTLIDHYLSEFDKLEDVELDTEGNVIAMMKDGKRVEDQHMNIVKFDAYAKEKASNYFKFLVQGAKGGAGNGKQPGSNSGGNGGFFTGMDRKAAYDHYTKLKLEGKSKPEDIIKMAQELQSMQS